MTQTSYNYFVAAAVIAAKLEKATQIAKKLSLTASNARALALRAGNGAAGFRPLTDFIDRLANITISSSQEINQIAAELSRMAANKYRADAAITRFDIVYQKIADGKYIRTLDGGYSRTKSRQQLLFTQYQKLLHKLISKLETLKDELRTAVILATLSRVEASQAGAIFHDQLNNVADNVESSAFLIKEHIIQSLELIPALERENE